MAIRMMVNASKADQPNVETVTNYWGHEVTRVHHDYKCPHKAENSAEGTIYPDCIAGQCEYYKPLYMETTYVGLVLDLYEHNGHNDSDFYAVVWDAEKGCADRIEYASTRGWTYPNGAGVDATPEVRAAYDEWRTHCAHVQAERAAEAERRRVCKGKRVRIVGGRKYKGKEGVVFWQGANQFRTYYKNGYNNPESPSNQRIGVETDSGEKFFTEYNHAEVILPQSE